MFKENLGNFETIVACNTKIKGDIESKENVLVASKIEGSIRTTQRVYIQENAEVHGNVLAQEVVIRGKIEGDVKSEFLKLFAPAHMRGNIETKTLSIEEKAFFEGNFKVGVP